MFFSASSLLPVDLESVRDFLCVGPPRASGGSVFRLNKSSCLSLIFVQWLKGRSAPKKFGTRSAARESSRVQSNCLQPLCDADGNSASSCRKWTCLTAHAGALNQRNSDAAIVCSIDLRNLNRSRNRTLGRSKKIPEISVEIMPPSAAIASGAYDLCACCRHQMRGHPERSEGSLKGSWSTLIWLGCNRLRRGGPSPSSRLGMTD